MLLVMGSGRRCKFFWNLWKLKHCESKRSNTWPAVWLIESCAEGFRLVRQALSAANAEAAAWAEAQTPFAPIVVIGAGVHGCANRILAHCEQRTPRVAKAFKDLLIFIGTIWEHWLMRTPTVSGFVEPFAIDRRLCIWRWRRE